MAGKDEATVVALKPMSVATMVVTVVGDSPLVVHNFGEKAREQIRQKQQKQARHLLRHIRVISEPGAEPDFVYFHVHTEHVDGYVTKARLMSDAELHKAALAEALKLLNGVLKRYNELTELAPVREALERIAS